MKKEFTMLLLGATLGVWTAQAQTEVPTHAKSDSAANSSSAAIMDDVMQTAIEAKNAKIKALELQVQALQDSICSQQQTILLLTQTIKAAQKQQQDMASVMENAQKEQDTQLTEMQQKVEAAEARRDEMENILKGMDVSIYKQCLLKPLERQFRTDYIKEALEVIAAFENAGTDLSAEFKKYKQVYEPLLKKYEEYNSELTACIEGHQKMFKMTGGKIEADHRQRSLQSLHNMTYYKSCFMRRNSPPYNSIPYLDEIIEEYEKLLLNSSGSVLDRIDDILKRLEPKVSTHT